MATQREVKELTWAPDGNPWEIVESIIVERWILVEVKKYGQVKKEKKLLRYKVSRLKRA